jgi:hypothetical protein
MWGGVEVVVGAPGRASARALGIGFSIPALGLGLVADGSGQMLLGAAGGSEKFVPKAWAAATAALVARDC